MQRLRRKDRQIQKDFQKQIAKVIDRKRLRKKEIEKKRELRMKDREKQCSERKKERYSALEERKTERYSERKKDGQRQIVIDKYIQKERGKERCEREMESKC